MGGGVTSEDSKNLRFIIEFLDKTNLLVLVGKDGFGKDGCGRKTPKAKVFSPSTSPLLYTLQCLFAPSLFSLNPKLINEHSGFPRAQQLAYSSEITTSIFGGVNGLDVNMQWLLANIQFWRHHLLRRDEGTVDAD